MVDNTVVLHYTIYKLTKKAMQMNQYQALVRLEEIMEELDTLGSEARGIFATAFPQLLGEADAYGVFVLGSSGNRYDTTLASMIRSAERVTNDECLEEEDY